MTERVLQFGEGNFLRAFIDAFIQELNIKGLFDGKVVVVQPIALGLADKLNEQKGRYNVLLRGLENGEPRVRSLAVDCISRAINPYTSFSEYMKTIENPQLRYIVSNTTEAGIAFNEGDKPDDKPPSSFPAKVTALLYERFKLFNGDNDKGFIFIPCELIDDNGSKLKEIVLKYAQVWQLPDDFVDWINTANYFTNTLVDRIVTGYPTDEIEVLEKEMGYKDDLLVAGEIFHFFAIEADEKTRAIIDSDLPFVKAGFNVVLTDNAAPYKLRKVRILNGAHTMSVLAAFLTGIDTVCEMIGDKNYSDFLEHGMYKEIIPTLLEGSGLGADELNSFADSVIDRFKNPHIKHYLLSIALNSVSKFKVRVLPTILEYVKIKNALPPLLTFSFASLLAFYKGNMVGEKYIGDRTGEEYEIKDDAAILSFMNEQWQAMAQYRHDLEILVRDVCANDMLWGQDLNNISGFCMEVTQHLSQILDKGITPALLSVLGKHL